MSIKSIHADILEGDKEIKEKGHLLLPFLYWGFMTIFMKLTEEKWLYNLYGEECAAYCKKVNRCIPWFKKL